MQAGKRKILPLLRVFVKYSKRYKKQVMLFVLLSLLSSILSALSPLLIGKFFDYLVLLSEGKTHVLKAVYIVLILWLVVQLIAVFLKWLSDKILSKTELLIEADLNTLAFGHVLKIPVQFHKSVKSGEISHKILSSASRFSKTFQMFFTNYVSNLIAIFTGFIMGIFISPQLALVLFVGVFLYLISSAFNLRTILDEQRRGWNAWKEAWGAQSDFLSNIFTLKYFLLEDSSLEKVENKFKDAVNKWLRPMLRWNRVNFIQGIFVVLTQLFILILGVKLVVESKISLGDLIAFNAYTLMVFGPLVSFVNEFSSIQNNLIVMRDYDKLLQERTELYNPKEHCVPENFVPSVEFKNVYFKYPNDNNYVLNGISFFIKPFSKVALVGGSGGGKTTTIDLISAYIFPSKGKVLVSGKNIKCLPLHYLRSHITIVPQETTLFNDTLKNNLLIAKPKAKEQELWQALEKAQLKDFVEMLPKKLNTQVGEKGLKLSVGQKQRLSIARAFLRDTPILILDEPTSALDAKTESELQKVFDELFKNKTVFIIAHRLATVRKVDKILVFDKGRIVEEGTHEELIKKDGGVYRELYELQKL